MEAARARVRWARASCPSVGTSGHPRPGCRPFVEVRSRRRHRYQRSHLPSGWHLPGPAGPAVFGDHAKGRSVSPPEPSVLPLQTCKLSKAGPDAADERTFPGCSCSCSCSCGRCHFPPPFRHRWLTLLLSRDLCNGLGSRGTYERG